MQEARPLMYDARKNLFNVGFHWAVEHLHSFLSTRDLIDRFANEISYLELGENGLNRPVTEFSLKILGLLAISLNSSYCVYNNFRQVQRFPPPSSKKAIGCNIFCPNQNQSRQQRANPIKQIKWENWVNFLQSIWIHNSKYSCMCSYVLYVEFITTPRWLSKMCYF